MWTVRNQCCVVTGAGSGIGREVALELAQRGAKVLVLGRSQTAIQGVVDEIVADDGVAWGIRIDLASLDSVREAAKAVKQRAPSIGVLVNNAGTAGIRGQTSDGFELAFGVNHLGHYLLTRELWPNLVSSHPARIINVASKAHLDASELDWDSFTRKTRTVTGIREYEQSKLCNVLFTRALTRRIPLHMQTYAIHPGVVASRIWRPIPQPIRWYMMRGMRTSEEGGEVVARLATQASSPAVNGAYFHRFDEMPPNPIVEDVSLQELLWARSANWCNISPENQ